MVDYLRRHSEEASSSTGCYSVRMKFNGRHAIARQGEYYVDQVFHSLACAEKRPDT